MERVLQQNDRLTDLAARVAQDLRRGDLTMRQVVGLSDREMNAVADAADALRRRGDLANAARLWGLLIGFDPYVPRYWRALADLQRRLGRHAEAVLCYEVLALVQGRDSQSDLLEARCLEALGEADLAAHLRHEGERRPRC